VHQNKQLGIVLIFKLPNHWLDLIGSQKNNFRFSSFAYIGNLMNKLLICKVLKIGVPKAGPQIKRIHFRQEINL